MENEQSHTRRIINCLADPVPDVETLLSILCFPLAQLSVLPPKFLRFQEARTHKDESQEVLKCLPAIQRAVLEQIVPTWELSLKERHLDEILNQYFCPGTFAFTSQGSGDISRCAYDTLVSSSLTDFSLRQLNHLATDYPIDRIHTSIFGGVTTVPPHRRQLSWDDSVRNIVSVPARVANYAQASRDVPESLSTSNYFSRLCIRSEHLLHRLSQNRNEDDLMPISVLMTKLYKIGCFPLKPPSSRGESSFFLVTLPYIRARIAASDSNQLANYKKFWSDLLDSLPVGIRSRITMSLIAHLTAIPEALDPSPQSRGLVKREAHILGCILGNISDADDEESDIWLSFEAATIAHPWNEAIARILVCWAVGIPNGSKALEVLLNKIEATWTSTEHIKHSSIDHHHYLTAFLLLTLTNLPRSSSAIEALAFSSPFINSISTYIGHLEPSIRRCGMLAVEEVARLSGKQLNFGDWDGDPSSNPNAKTPDWVAWSKRIRTLISENDIAAVQVDWDIERLEMPEEQEPRSDTPPPSSTPPRPHRSLHPRPSTPDSDDDSLQGYASDSPPSSRAPSPTHSEYEELEMDPTLNVGAKKVQKPVYLADLGTMLRGSTKQEDGQEEADKIQVALGCAEELIRRKRGFGLELEENAVNLAYGLVSLNNNYELEGFDEKRQAALNALVACCPQKAAPCLIDEFFKNQYSTLQRFVVLTALAIGARELASLPIPTSKVATSKLSFPSKKLPPSAHQKYLTDNDLVSSDANALAVRNLVTDISRNAIHSAGSGIHEDKEMVRERRLRIRQPAKVVEVQKATSELSYPVKDANSKPTSGINQFTALASPYFLSPLMSQFWTYLRDSQVREERTMHRTSYSYRGTGTGLILSPMVLSQYLGTIAVLIHAARFSPVYLAILAPDALELAVTLGTRPMSLSSSSYSFTDGTADEESVEGESSREASVLNAALDLALVTLDGCIDLDHGRSMSLEHTSLIMAAREWGGRVLELFEEGVRLRGGGGKMSEVNIRGTAAGLVLKVEEITSRWRRSMVTV